jgi:hypothetical protein
MKNIYIGCLCHVDLFALWHIYWTLRLLLRGALLLDVLNLHNASSMFPAKNEEFVRLRMKDAIASTVQEELFGNQYAEFGWAPHDFHYNR